MTDKTYSNAGVYDVEVTLRLRVHIGQGESETEDGLLADCRRLGEMVDWQVTEWS